MLASAIMSEPTAMDGLVLTYLTRKAAEVAEQFHNGDGLPCPTGSCAGHSDGQMRTPGNVPTLTCDTCAEEWTVP